MTLGNSVTTIGNNAFINCTGLTSVTIPNSVTELGAGAFAECSNLRSATLPNAIVLIPTSCFDGCTRLESVNIPDSVTSIWGLAFAGCRNLPNITIPKSVRAIDSKAFQDCYSLMSVTCLATTPPWLGNEDCFDDDCYKNAGVFVPAQAVETYRAARFWDKFIGIQPITSENMPGDVNSDGLTNITDLNSVIDVVIMGGNAGHPRVPGIDGDLLEDVNGDGAVNISDINLIIYYILNN